MPETLETLFRAPIVRTRAGHFGADLELLCGHLQESGLSARTVVRYLRAAAHLIHCVEQGWIQLDGLTARDLRGFVHKHVRRCSCRTYKPAPHDLRAVAAHLLEVMRQCGRPVVPPSLVPAKQLPDVLRRFDEHLRDERGLAAASRSQYLKVLVRLRKQIKCEELADVSAWTGEQLRDFVLDRRKAGPWPGRHAAVAIRTFLRFAVVRGYSVGALMQAIPSLPNRKLASVPSTLTDKQLKTLMECFDTRDPLHLRDRAVVECLATLGMRAGEVASLRLGAIDWRAGVLRIEKSKGRRADVLPLPPTVGRAITAYLRHGRPKTTDDHVFVRHQYPVGMPFESHGISHLVQRVYRRANLRLPSTGAHILRRTAASRMVQGGASIKDVADVLRHRDLDTTRIYAKVDWPRLVEVALAWPAAVRP